MADQPVKTSEGVAHSHKKSPPNRWLCKNCNAVLGFTDTQKKVLRIKYKDLFCYFSGGSCTLICRQCGTPNTVGQVDSSVQELVQV